MTALVAGTVEVAGSDVVSWPAAVASLSLVALTVVLAALLGLGVGREIVIASVRAAIPLLAVGLLFTVLFESTGARWWAFAWIVVMIGVATVVVVRRAKHHVTGLLPTTLGTVLGSTIVSLTVVFGFGVLDDEPVALVVIAGITIGNAVPSAVLAVNQSVGVSRDGVGEIEAVLAMGFNRRQVMQFMAPRAARTALIPQIERTKVVGLIALPGAMTGLLLAGVDPIDAVVIQLLVMYLVLGTATLCVVAITAVVTYNSVDDGLSVEGWVRVR
ncbi:MAG: ABC transporter permease [Ilumatobacteraceae bacterium]